VGLLHDCLRVKIIFIIISKFENMNSLLAVSGIVSYVIHCLMQLDNIYFEPIMLIICR